MERTYEEVRALIDDLRLCDPDQVTDGDINIVIDLALGAGVITESEANAWR